MGGYDPPNPKIAHKPKVRPRYKPYLAIIRFRISVFSVMMELMFSSVGCRCETDYNLRMLSNTYDYYLGG